MSSSEVSDDWINCCSKSIHDCGNFNSHGYNCFGLDSDGNHQPCGVIQQKKLDQLIIEHKIGPCKCASSDEPCTCGIFLVTSDSSDSKTIYLSNFIQKIQSNASDHNHLQSIYALDHGTEIQYFVSNDNHTPLR